MNISGYVLVFSVNSRKRLVLLRVSLAAYYDVMLYFIPDVFENILYIYM